MLHLKQLLKTNYQLPTWLSSLIIILPLIGLTDAGFLAINKLNNTVPPCTVLSGCEAVTTSQYSAILGVPVAYLGVLFYITMLALAVAYIDKKKNVFLLLISVGSVFGFLFSAWFVFVQLAILNAICIYCMGSAASSSLLFGCGIYLWYKLKQQYLTERS